MRNAFDKNLANRRFKRFFFYLSKGFVRLFYRLEYVGLENFPTEGPAILISNHTSMADMLAIHTPVKPWIYWVAKKELFTNKFLHGFYSRLGCIPVDRDKADLLAARGIFTAIRDKKIIGMFPQGTRVKLADIPSAPLRSGAVHFAIKTGAPILPVAVSGRFKIGGKVRVVYGEMFKLDADPHGHYSAEQLNDMMADIMRRVYALIDYDYQPAKPPVEPQ